MIVPSRSALAAAILMAGAVTCAGQSTGESTGFYLYERLDVTRNTLGFITRFDSTGGYNFNRHFALEAGLPVFVVRPGDGAAMQRANGIGNARLTARLTAATPAITYLATLTATAPTGDEDKGLSTGKATWDWNNHFEHSFGPITPFGALGVANTIADTPLYIRPYISQGLVTHFEGGARVRLAARVSAGGSLYAFEPSGEQTVISRVTRNGPRAAGRGRKQGVFEVNQTTVGPAAIARDRGGSIWLSFGPFSVVDFQAGYTRSATYALNTVFFGVGVNAGSLIRKARP